mgnify:FL=1
MYYLIVYILMMSSLVISDFIFLGGILGFVHVTLGGFSTMLWGMAILVFVCNIMLTLSTEKNEFTLSSALLSLLMLFTYAKLWVIVVLKALWLSFEDQVFHREVKWDKTVRYEETLPDEEEALPQELLHKKGR